MTLLGPATTIGEFVQVTESRMDEKWNWVPRYIAVIVIALILAAALGSMDLFKTTAVISKKLTAAHIVQFLGYGAALAVFWLLGQRAAIVLGQQGGRWGFLQHVLVPLVTLIVVASAHSVLLLVVGPLMDAGLRNVYNWVFIAAIIAAAVWLVMAFFNQSASFTDVFASSAPRPGSSSKSQGCPRCGARPATGAKFCAQCGANLSG